MHFAQPVKVLRVSVRRASGNALHQVSPAAHAVKVVPPLALVKLCAVEARVMARTTSQAVEGMTKGQALHKMQPVAGIQPGRNLAPKAPNQREWPGEFITVTLKKSENTENKPQKPP